MVSVDVDIVSFQLPASSFRLDAERGSASTRRLGIRVVEDEPLADQTRVVVERRAVDEAVTFRVDENLGAVRPFEHVIAGARRRLPGERVAQTRAAAGLDADAQTAIGEAVLRGHLLDELSCVLADLQHMRRTTTRTVLYYPPFRT